MIRLPVQIRPRAALRVMLTNYPAGGARRPGQAIRWVDRLACRLLGHCHGQTLAPWHELRDGAPHPPHGPWQHITCARCDATAVWTYGARTPREAWSR